MKKMSSGYINCLTEGIQKGYIWNDQDIWVNKSWQKNRRYTSKLEELGFIIKVKSYGFYHITEEGINYIKKLVTI